MFKTRVLSQLRREKIESIMDSMGVEEKGREIMDPKGIYRLIYAEGLDPRAANIVKQEFLSVGGEAAVSWEALNMSEENSKILMMGTLRHYSRVVDKLREQPFNLQVLADEIEDVLENFGNPSTHPYMDEFGDGCKVMGILNVTPDSFYDGKEYERKEEAVRRAVEMVENGADIIDIGGESTRPGSERISVKEEKERVIPVIEELSDNIDVPMSIDTYKPEVAEAAVSSGADMVNDVFGLRKKGMPETVADLGVPVIIMHMQGTPGNMQEDPTYENVVHDIYSFFVDRIEEAVEAGIEKKNLILDPGIGFGKTLEHNLEIIKRLDEFTSLGRPLLLGASRKSFLGQVLGKDAGERLYGSLAAASIAVERGVSILRVHDVDETADVVKTVEEIRKN